MSQTVYGKLFFTEVTFSDLAGGVNPNFQCPICRYVWRPKLSLGTTFPSIFDYNQKVAFAIPIHVDVKTSRQCAASEQKIELFVAVRKDEDGLKLCIQRSDVEGANGITANWWQRNL